MDRLLELTSSLQEEEQRLFRKFLTHGGNNKNRKDIQLFNQLCESDKISQSKKSIKIAASETDGAYRRLRYRVKESIQDYIYQQVRKDDTPLYINKLIAIARFLYLRKKHPLSWKYLEEAENIASKAEEYELLNQVYQHMIEYAWTQPKEVLRKVINKERENQVQAQATRSLNLALSVINNELRVSHVKGSKANIDKIIKKALAEFDVKERDVQKASQYYKLAMLVKLNLEEKKEHKQLYNYMIQLLSEMEKAALFDKYNYRYKVEILNIICYASARAGDYETAQKYIRIIEEENKIYPETDFLSIQSFMAKVVCLVSTGKAQEALDVLEYLRNKYQKLYHDDDYFFTTLNNNHSAIHMHIGNPSVSRKGINELLNNANRVVRYFGLEGLFYCQATECLLATEEMDFDYSSSRILAIERKFKPLLTQSHQKRNCNFIKLLKYISTKRDKNPWKIEKIRNMAWDFIKMKPIYEHGPEFISFNAWVYSKLENIKYDEAVYNILIVEKIKL